MYKKNNAKLSTAENFSVISSLRHQWLVRSIKFLLLAILLYFVGTAIIERIIRISWDRLVLDFRFFSLAMMAAVVVRILMGALYGVMLRLLDISLPYPIPMAVSWVTGLGKYVPGKIAIISSVIYILGRYNVRASIAAIVPALSNVLIVLISLILSLPLLFSPLAQDIIPFSEVWFILLIIAGVVAVWPQNFLAVANFLLRLAGRPQLNITLNLRQMILTICIVLGQCLFTGLITWCTARSISPLVGVALIPLMVSISVFGGTLGILAIFSPAGLGVIEGVYLLLLSPLLGGEMAALLAVCIRLLQLAADILMGIVGMLILHFFKSNENLQ